MNRQMVREILYDWGSTKKRVEKELQKLLADELTCEGAAGLRARIMDSMPHGAGITDPTQRAAQELIKVHDILGERIKRSRKKISTLLRDEWMVDCLLEDLPNNMQELINLKYRERKTYIDAAQEMGCTEINAKKIECAAVEMLGGMIY